METTPQATVEMLRDALCNKDKSDGDDDGWIAGEQLVALAYYLPSEAAILAQWKESSYPGECFAIILWRNTIFLWNGSFGSCCGCDALDGADGYEYIYSTITPGKTRAFQSLDELDGWLKNTNHKPYLPYEIGEHLGQVLAMVNEARSVMQGGQM